MNRQNNCNNLLEQLKKEIELITTEQQEESRNNKELEDKCIYIKNEFRSIRSAIDTILKGMNESILTYQDPEIVFKPGAHKKVKMGSGWVVEKDRIVNISMIKKIDWMNPILQMEVSNDKKMIGVVTNQGAFVYFIEQNDKVFLDGKGDEFLDANDLIRHQIFRSRDIKISFSWDSEYIFTFNEENYIKKWSVATRKARRMTLLQQINVATTLENKNYCVANMCTCEIGDEIVDLKFGNCLVTCIATKNEMVLMGNTKGEIIIYDTATKKKSVFRIHDAGVTCLRVHDDLIVSGGIDKRVRVSKINYDEMKIEEVSGFNFHDDLVHSVDFIDSKQFVSASRDNTFRIWNFERDSMIVFAHSAPVVGIKVVDNKIYTASADNFLCAWEFE